MNSRIEPDCFSEILKRQIEWARGSGRDVGEDGYLRHYEENFFQPLSPSSLAAYETGSGSELLTHAASPAKMAATYSSAALVVNVFDYWVDGPYRALEEAMAFGSAIEKVRLEQPFKTGLGGSAPHLDVEIRLKSSTLVGVESKFTEWFRPKPNQGDFRESYGQGARWVESGLPRCGELVAKMVRGEVEFLYLDAAQLLKHALGLRKASEDIRVYYLYYDCQRLASVQQLEIDRFTALVGGEIGFTALTYQSLFVRLECTTGPEDGEYLGYLMGRYS